MMSLMEVGCVVFFFYEDDAGDELWVVSLVRPIG